MITRQKQKAKERRIHRNAGNIKNLAGKKLHIRAERIAERARRSN